MAQEKDRAVRARKTTKGESRAAAAKTEKAKTAPSASGRKATPKKETAAKRPATPKASTAKTSSPATTTATRKTAATVRGRRSTTLAAVPEPTREEIAFRAYLLWEQGVPGDETEHWLRAEAELRAA
jgi:hypothetical protein